MTLVVQYHKVQYIIAKADMKRRNKKTEVASFPLRRPFPCQGE